MTPKEAEAVRRAQTRLKIERELRLKATARQRAAAASDQQSDGVMRRVAQALADRDAPQGAGSPATHARITQMLAAPSGPTGIGTMAMQGNALPAAQPAGNEITAMQGNTPLTTTSRATPQAIPAGRAWEAQLPDGTIIEFPGSVSQEQGLKIIKQNYPELDRSNAAPATGGTATPQQLLAAAVNADKAGDEKSARMLVELAQKELSSSTSTQVTGDPLSLKTSGPMMPEQEVAGDEEGARRLAEAALSSPGGVEALMQAAKRAQDGGDPEAAKRLMGRAIEIEAQIRGTNQPSATSQTEQVGQNLAAEAQRRGMGGPWEKYGKNDPGGLPSRPWEKYATPTQAGAGQGPLAKLRAQFPQYGDLSDRELADGLYERYYSDMPRAEYYQRLGIPAPGHTGGLSSSALDGALFGFGDEYLAGLSSVLGVQPDGQGGANWFDYSQPIGDRYNTALDAIRSEQGHYEVENPGKSVTASVAGAFLGPGKGAGGFVNKAATTRGRIGRSMAAGGGLSAAYGFGEGEGLANRVQEGGAMVPVGLLGGAVLGSAGEGFNRAVQVLRGRTGAGEAIPTVESLKSASQELYRRAEASGATITGPRMQALARLSERTATQAGFDRQLHPRVAAVLDRLKSEAGPKSLGEMEILRRVAKNAAASLQPDERRIAMKLIDHIDKTALSMKGGEAVGQARVLWAKQRRLETVEELIEKAATYDSFERGLQNVFRTLIRNPKRLKGFTSEEIKAFRRVASGSNTQKAFKALGNLLNINSVSGIGIAGGATYASGGTGGLATAAGGFASRKVANALTRADARAAHRTVAHGGALPPLPPNGLMSMLPAPMAAETNSIIDYLENRGKR